MKVQHLYTGLLSYWERCEENHEQNAPGNRFFYTDKQPDLSYNVSDWRKCDPVFYDIYEKNAELYANKAPETSVQNCWNMWHNIFVGFSLLPKDADIYVRNRTDIVFTGPMNYEAYDVSRRAVFIPSGNDYWYGINDQAAFGSYEVMKAYCSLYLNVQKYYDEGRIFHPESMLKWHLDQCGIEIVRLPITNRKNE